MKILKTLLVVIFATILFSTNIKSQETLPFSEDFSGVILPTGWTNTDNSGDGTVWEFNNPANRIINSTTAGNGFAIFDSYNWGLGLDNNCDLITPRIDMSDDSVVWLTMEHYFRQGVNPPNPPSVVRISVSNDNGVTWTSVENWSSSTSNVLMDTINLTTWAAYQDSVKVKFNFTGSYNWYWAIDDILIYDPTDEFELISWISPGASNCNASATSTIQISVRNNGLKAADSIPVSYSIDNGSTWAYDTIYTSIAVGQTYIFSYPTTADFYTKGIYNCYVVVRYSEDQITRNDTNTFVVTNKVDGDYPYIEDFEGSDHYWTSGGTNNTWALGTPTYGITSAHSGTKTWCTNLSGYYNNNEASYIYPTCAFNFTNLNRPVVDFYMWRYAYVATYPYSPDYDYLEMYYKTDGVWTLLNTTHPTWDWYNFTNKWYSGNSWWVRVRALLPESLGGEDAIQFKMQFTSTGNYQSAGYAVDDFSIYEYPCYKDVAVLSFTKPYTGSSRNCGLTSTEDITIKIINYSVCDTISNIPVRYSINGGSTIEETYSGTILPLDTATYTFAAQADLSEAPNVYNITAWTALTEDTVNNNSKTIVVTHQEFIDTFPYFEDFENVNGKYPWYTEGSSNNSWEVGIPTLGITSAHSGDSAWCTNLDGNYNISEVSYVYSPCFSFDSITNPVVDTWIWRYSTDENDYLDLQYTTSSGWGNNVDWYYVNTYHPTWNWYNYGNTWYSDNSGWVNVKALQPESSADASYIRFRFHFISDNDGTVNKGYAFDDFQIYEYENHDDIAVISFTSPNTTSAQKCDLTNTETIAVKIANYEVLDTFFNFPVRYSINGGTIINETCTDTVFPLDTITYTFTTKANLSETSKVYTIYSWTDLATDEVYNDSSNISIRNMETIDTFPYYEDFENTGGKLVWYAEGSYSSWALGRPTVGITSAHSGDSAWCTNLSGYYNNNELSYVYSPCFNFDSIDRPVIDFYLWRYSTDAYDYVDLQYTTTSGWGNDVTWNTVTTYHPTWNWYNSGATWYSDNSGWVNVKSLLLPALGDQSYIRFRFHFQSNSSGQNYGYAFDDFQIYNYEPNNDIAVIAFTEPYTASAQNCGLTSTEDITVKITNYEVVDTFSNFPVRYSINGNVVYETCTDTIPPLDTITYTFTTKANLSETSKVYTIYAWTDLFGDGNYNDSCAPIAIRHMETINTFPYNEDFENTGGKLFWYAEGSYSSWALGRPTVGITSAHSGDSAWCTNLSGYYNNNELSYVYSPCFNFDSIERPVIDTWIWRYSTDAYDYMDLQYTTTSGWGNNVTWNTITTYHPTWNWYNSGATWYSNNSGWVNVKALLPAAIDNASYIRFRFHFQSNSSGQNYGYAFDDFQIYEYIPNNDVAVISYTSPYTNSSNNCGLTSNQNITVKITNYEPIDSFWNIPVRYSINGSVVSATCTDTVLPLDTITYTFTTKANLSTAPGEYNIYAWTDLAGDKVYNDSSYIRIRNMQTISTYPYYDNFDGTGTSTWFAEGTNNSWAVGTPTGYYGINTTHSGAKAWCTNLNGKYNANELSYVYSPCFDFTDIKLPVINTWIWRYASDADDYMDLQYTTTSGWGNNVTWYNVTSTNPNWIWYNQTTKWYGPNSGWVNVKALLPSSLGNQPYIRFRFHFQSDADVEVDAGTAGVTNAGYAIDDFRIYDSIAPYDAGIDSIHTPNHCGLSNAEDIKVDIIGHGKYDFSNCVVKYRINGGVPISETVPNTISYQDTLTYTFTTKANLSANGIYIIDAWTDLSSPPGTGEDTVPINDSVLSKEIRSCPIISTFTHLETFEGGANYWYTKGRNNSWEFGTPSGDTIDCAFSGNNCWITNLDGMYNANEKSYVYSPCFDLSDVSDIIIETQIWYSTNVGGIKDKAYLEASTNGGITWSRVADNDADWYNDIDNNHSWAGSSTNWVNVKTDNVGLEGENDVKFRFVFQSDNASKAPTGGFEGFAFDNFKIYDQDVLPIELVSFSAILKNGIVELNWSTATEINNDYFTILRSIDGINYEEIEKVDGAGNSCYLINYQEFDFEPIKGISYYKLQQTDFDGNLSISDVEIIMVDGIEIISIYPNPANNIISLELISYKNTKVNVRIIDNYGQIMYYDKYQVNKDLINKYQIDVSLLSKGSYFVEVFTNSGLRKIQKIVLIN